MGVCETRSVGLENKPGRIVEVEEAEEAEEESSITGDEGISLWEVSSPKASSSSVSSNISRWGGGAFRGIRGSRGSLASFAFRNSRWKSLMAEFRGCSRFISFSTEGGSSTEARCRGVELQFKTPKKGRNIGLAPGNKMVCTMMNRKRRVKFTLKQM